VSAFGNAAALDAADLVEYLGDDDRVSVLAAYLEGIGQADGGDHERFTSGLARVAAKKPAIIWKGGATADGARVTANHTGSAPVTSEDWGRILETTGAIGVDSMEELVDTTATIAAHAQRATKPFFAIVSAAETERRDSS
jgi:acyl-CoA synthetase (NDP forming)